MSKIDEKSDTGLSFHDYLSLGETRAGLKESQHSNIEEIHRLPCLLRLLSETRPMASVSVLQSKAGREDEHDILHPAVASLEHVAATHSQAEGVDVVACHLAPHVSKRIARLKPLKHSNGRGWNTTHLEEVAKNPTRVHKSTKRRKLDDGDGDTPEAGIEATYNSQSEDEEDHGGDDEDHNGQDFPPPSDIDKDRKRRRVSSGPESTQAQDSQEAIVTKTLSDLAMLVADSLKIPTEEKKFSLSMEDSVLAETSIDIGGGGMSRSDLGATISSIMHHAPVLRSRHVAAALCRAALPQTKQVLARIGANCPLSIPALIRGCLEAYEGALRYREPTIMASAKRGLIIMAGLSPTTSSLVQNAIDQASTFKIFDVQLKLALLQRDTTLIACLLIRHLSDVGDAANQTGMLAAPSKNHHDDDDDNVAVSEKEPGPAQLLADDAPLIKDVLNYFSKAFRELNDEIKKKTIIYGRLTLVLRGFALLVLHISKIAGKFSTMLENDIIPQLMMLGKELEQAECKNARLLDTFFCTAVLTAAFALRGQQSKEQQDITVHADLIQTIKVCATVSDEVKHIFSLLKKCHDENVRISFRRLMRIISETGCENFVRLLFSQLKGDLRCLGQAIALHDDQTTTETIGNIESIDMRAISYLASMDRDRETEFYEKAQTLLNEILSTSNHKRVCVDGKVCDNITTYVVKATKYLIERDVVVIPCVLPLQLEMTYSSLHRQGIIGGRSPQVSSEMCHFLLQMVHSFVFLETSPTSPFAFEPYVFPIKESLGVCEELENMHGSAVLSSTLVKMINDVCPDTAAQYQRWKILRDQTFFSFSPLPSGQSIATDFGNALKVCKNNMDGSVSDYHLESLFLRARLTLSDQQICEKVAAALLLSPQMPLRHYSYSQLCKDPIILLQCTMNVWASRGFRHICLRVLVMLLETNETLVTQKAPSQVVAEELIASRDSILVRCLLTALGRSKTAHGNNEDSNSSFGNCAMTTSIIRSRISKQRGIVSMLIRQGLNEEQTDWLIENVPESFGDRQNLMTLLSDGSPLTPAEKLMAADAVLRISVVHGDTHDEESGAMCYAALSQLVQRFFLILGPVGVPVNALMHKEDVDVTQVARRAAFRMLVALLSVKGPRKLFRAECSIVLNRLASICKSESSASGLPGKVAGRRKLLLRELLDAITKAASALGIVLGPS